MATAGRILIMPKGAWNESVSYENLDLVSHNSRAWIAKKTSVGIEPSDANAEYWHDFLGDMIGLEAHTSDKNNPHDVTAEQIGLGNVDNVSTNDQTPTYDEASEMSELASGEKLNLAFGKIAKGIKELILHLSNKENPHKVTLAQLNTAPVTILGADLGEGASVGYADGTVIFVKG
jgi:hypothetical protein